MRQGQQNRRGRGRNNNSNSNNNTGNRKSQNPLTRSFESAGPDVKLRGTPSHIAEKYISLARDAQSSGDPVLAENYLQHAEHYNRIILGVREQQVSQGGEPFAGGAMARTHSLAGPEGGEGDEFGDEDGDEFGVQGQQGTTTGDGQPQPMQPPPRSFDQPQRFDNRPPRHDNRGDNNRGENRQNNNHQRNDRGDHQRFDRNDRQDRGGNDRGANDRGDRQDFRGDRNGNVSDNRGFRDDRDRRPQQGQQGDQQPGDGNGLRRRDRFQGPQGGPNGFDRDRDAGPRDAGPGNFQPPPMQPSMPSPVQVQPSSPPPSPHAAAPELEQPAFLRRPVRRPRRDDSEAAPAPRPAVTEDQD